MFAFGMRHLFFMRFTGIPHHLKGKGSNMEPWVSMRFLVRSLRSEHVFSKVIQVTSLGYTGICCFFSIHPKWPRISGIEGFPGEMPPTYLAQGKFFQRGKETSYSLFV